ncbi:kinesin-like protein KIN-14S isoform X1 [Prunus yedoensis var. nudiflora]|uniref:Kinesin-like protein KIN-14S isoform X1 n=1 Tax=Prunus yedoensis var. nudiflora TaxID=2094558 RepID=A0A314YRX3_PRUYE|nr:kinesin-like protein KIN-14S isoform X1 [Prunus yedoensis var. nudiflora]
MTTPLHTSASRFNNGRQSFMRDPRKARYSRLFSPMPELTTEAETTPATMRRSSKFMGSPRQHSLAQQRRGIQQLLHYSGNQ